MTRWACRRCDWTPEPEGGAGRGQLVGHRVESGHPLCILCATSLPDDRPLTCLPCLADVRRSLAALVDLYALLPAAMMGGAYGEPSKPRSDGGEPAFPGGDALVMLAGGSRGLEQLRSDDPEPEIPGDPESVAFELGRWEDDWRLTRGEPAATGVGTVAGAAGYLEVRMGWAADRHLAFDEFAGDVRRLLSRLRTATATDDRPEVGAPCFEGDCGGTLHRAWTETGLSEDWSCPRCRRVYEPAAYWLAVRSEMETRRALQDWVPLQEAVDASRRPHKTIRTWMARGQVLAACRLADRQLVVWWPHVYERVFSTERRTARRRSA